MADLKGGRQMVSRPPAFSADGLKLLVCTGSTLSVFSVATGLLVTELDGHRDEVTGVVVVPAGADKLLSQCWTSSLDATLRLWDFISGSLLRVLKVQRPVVYMAIPFPNGVSGDLYAFLSVERKEKEKESEYEGCTVVYNLCKEKEIKGKLMKTYKPQQLVVSRSGKFVGMTEKMKICVWKSNDKDIDNVSQLKCIRLHSTKEFCSLAFHPLVDSIVAGGDVTGRVLVWGGVGLQTVSVDGRKKSDKTVLPTIRADDDALSLTTWHWHQSKVQFLSFSSDGSYLYSGGREGVLVIWQLETGKNTFFPRLGGPLLFLAESPEPSLFSISCASNKILFISISNMKIQKSIDGIKPPDSLPASLHLPLSIRSAAEYKTGIIALPADGDCVQIFDVYHDQPVFEVTASMRNYLSADQVSEFITLVAISEDGKTMGTVEMKVSEENVSDRLSLMFWSINARNKQAHLSTIIEEPHGEGVISSLIFHPRTDMAVSCSYSGNFKVWVGRKNNENQYGWSCRSVGSYKQKAMLCAAFSADGSLLAVGTGEFVTLWNPETNALISVIGESLHITLTKSLSFIPQSHHLVTVTNGATSRLSVWNLSTLSIWWSYDLLVHAIASDPNSPNFVVLVPLPSSSSDKLKREEDSAVILFNVEDPNPRAVWVVRKGKGGTLFFIKRSQGMANNSIVDRDSIESVLVFLNRDHEYVILKPYCDEDDTFVERLDKFSEAKEKGLSGYESIYGRTSHERDSTTHMETFETDKITWTNRNNSWEEILNGPSHVIPSLTRIGPAFLESLLERRVESK